MQDGPDSFALLEIIGETLRNRVIPELTGPAAYQARIAANLLSVMIRASRASARDNAVETASLQRLLGASETELNRLNARFAAGIRERALTLDTPGVEEHLWRTTLAKLAVDQPGYARYRQTVEMHGGVAPQGVDDAPV